MSEIINPNKLLNKEFDFRRSKFDAIVFVTDLGDDLALAECRLSLNEVLFTNRTMSPTLIAVNDVARYNKVHAAFHLQRLSNIASPNTIFIGVVDPGVGTERKSIVIETEQENFFVGPDNGIFYPAATTKRIKRVWEIDKNRFPQSSATFHGRDVFSKVAALIACDVGLDTVAIEINELVQLQFQNGQIVHIDSFGNLKVNQPIPSHTRHLVLPDKIRIPIVNTFEDVDINQPLAYLGSSGLLEVAIREGNAAETFGTRIGDCLRIQFA